MNRQLHFNSIEEKLSFLAYRIGIRGKLNLLDLNLHSENFYQHFFNILFGWQLQNINTIKHNTAGIDLVDNTKKIIVQVSATSSKQKIESALSKDLSNYQDYSFKFISIANDASDLRIKTFVNPYNLTFNPNEDIFDIPSILKIIATLSVDKQADIDNFLKTELQKEPDTAKIESNLTTIITVISKEDWNPSIPETISFDIETKITYNELKVARVLIDDYKIHNHRIDKIYSEFNKQGKNKSLSVLNSIRSEYLSLYNTSISADDLFFEIIKKVMQKVLESSNFVPIPEEELRLCVQIIVVDSFIRCKIFKNPSGVAHVNS